MSNNYSTGSPVIYAKGGNGGAPSSGTGPAGVNPGDGGGGGGNNSNSSSNTAGGSGIVILRYRIS